MVKNTQAIRQQEPTNCLNVLDHFVGLALKGLNKLAQLENSEFYMIWSRALTYEVTMHRLKPWKISQIFWLSTAQKGKFSIKAVNVFAEEILNEKLQCLRSVDCFA